MNTKVLTSEVDCRKYWELFSPHETLYDEWDFRMCFAKQLASNLHFILLLQGKEQVGLIPLVEEDGKYMLFGGDYPDQNRIFLKDKSLLKQAIAACPSPAKIRYLRQDQQVDDVLLPETNEYTYRYYLDLTKHNSLESFMSTMSKKHRKNLKSDLKDVALLNPAVSTDQFDFKKFVFLQVKNFGDESYFSDENMVKGFEELMNWAKQQGKLRTISILVNGVIESMSVSIFHKGIWTFLNSATNKSIPNLGKFLIATTLKAAMTEHCTEFDAMSYDLGWKQLWNLEKQPLFYFEK
ncbi:MAG: GNAT family N-acetyltransferase [archaeon]